MKNTVSKTFVGIFLYLAFVVAAFSEEKPDYSKTDVFIKKWKNIEDSTKFGKKRKQSIERELNDVSPKMKELIYALSCGDFDTASDLAKEIDLQTKDRNGQNILLFHSATPDTPDFSAQIYWILEHGIDIDVDMPIQITKLLQEDGSYERKEISEPYVHIFANRPNFLECVKSFRPELLDKVNPRNGKTPLSFVSDYNIDHDSIDFLLTFGADINSVDSRGYTPPIQAVVKGNYRNALKLLSYGAKPSIKFSFDKIEYADIYDYLEHSSRSQDEDRIYKRMVYDSVVSVQQRINMYAKQGIIRLLRDRRPTDATSVDKPDSSFSSQRLYDKTDSFLELEKEEYIHDRRSAHHNLKEILDNDLPNKSDETKECIYALACGDIKTVDMLKDKANLKARAVNGDSAFLKHAHNANVSTFSKQIRWCHKNGINLDCMMKKRVVAGGEPVDEMYIEHISYNPAVAALIELVPELLNKRNPYNGQTAIFRASNTETLRIFLNAGAELDIIDNAGETVLIRSVLRSEYENAILLVSYGADSKIPFEINDTPGDSRKTVYTSLLDFLLNSSRSHNEDKDLLENRETLRSKRTQKPKEALIALLKRLE